MESLRDQVAYLREMIATRDEEIRRRDVIISQLTSRIPEIEAPASGATELRESPESTAPTDTRTEASEAPETGAQEQERLPWWRRWFGA